MTKSVGNTDLVDRTVTTKRNSYQIVEKPETESDSSHYKPFRTIQYFKKAQCIFFFSKQKSYIKLHSISLEIYIVYDTLGF